jgi:hypothetical protein
MMRDFHMNLEAALEMPLAQAWALMAWSIEANPWGTCRRTSDGYIAQEAYRVMDGATKVSTKGATKV